MKKITENLQKLVKSRGKNKIVYKQPNIKYSSPIIRKKENKNKV
jgi:hypothetical protein